jgi:hypothetical protein
MRRWGLVVQWYCLLAGMVDIFPDSISAHEHR